MAGRIKRTVKGCFRNAAGKGLAVAKTARAALARMREQQAAEQERKWQLLNRGGRRIFARRLRTAQLVGRETQLKWDRVQMKRAVSDALDRPSPPHGLTVNTARFDGEERDISGGSDISRKDSIRKEYAHEGVQTENTAQSDRWHR